MPWPLTSRKTDGAPLSVVGGRTEGKRAHCGGSAQMYYSKASGLKTWCNVFRLAKRVRGQELSERCRTRRKEVEA